MSKIVTTPGNPSGHGSVIGASLIHASDLHKPEYDSQYYKRYKGFDFIALMESLGRKTAIRNKFISHFERPRTEKAFQVGTGTAGSAGALKQVAIHANSHNSNGQSFPIVGDIVMFSNGVQAKVVAKDTTANANTIDCVPLISTELVPALTALDYVIVISQVSTTGSSAPGSRKWEPFKVDSYLQIIRANHTIDNSATLSEAWVNFTLEDDDPLVGNGIFRAGNYKFLADEAHTYELFQIQRELALVFGVQADNTTITSSGNDKEQYTTHGLIPSIKDHGINPAAYVAGAYALSNLETVTTQLLQNGGGNEYLKLCGITLSQEMNAFIHNLFQNGGVTYGAFGGSKDRAVEYGFSSFKVDGVTMHKKVYNVFSNPELFAASGFSYQGDAMYLPMDTVMDAKSNKRIPSLRLIYRGDGSYDRDIQTQIGGGMRPGINPTTSDDILSVDYLSECGLQTIALNRFVYQERTT